MAPSVRGHRRATRFPPRKNQGPSQTKRRRLGTQTKNKIRTHPKDLILLFRPPWVQACRRLLVEARPKHATMAKDSAPKPQTTTWSPTATTMRSTSPTYTFVPGASAPRGHSSTKGAWSAEQTSVAARSPPENSFQKKNRNPKTKPLESHAHAQPTIPRLSLAPV